MNKKNIAICGAGIAGTAAAYYLTQQLENCEVILIDQQQPLAYTSSKSGENFRDYWPHSSMEALSSHSIDLMEDLQKKYGKDAFDLTFSGYHFVSHNTNKAIFADDSSKDFRKKNQVELNAKIIHQQHPYLDKGIQKSVFIKKAGHVDSITMANLLLQKSKPRGLKILEGEIVNIQKAESSFVIQIKNSSTIKVNQVILATGPFLNHTAKLLSLSFPIWNTLQRKFIIPDPLRIVPPDMPFTIYTDSQTLAWESEEKKFMATSEDLKWMTEPFPGAIHIKPESGGRIKMGWAFSTQKVEPQWQIPTLEYFPQVVLKGASRFIPALKNYVEKMPTPVIEYGGYYTRNEENWPLVGPTEIEGVFVIGALAGFGTMTACGVGELCARYISGMELPWYAEYFHPNRYDNPKIKKVLEELDKDGQL